MSFIEISALTMIKPANGKGESKTSYIKRLVNIDYITDIMDDPHAKDLVHLTTTNGKILAEGTKEKIKKLITNSTKNGLK